MPVHCIHIFVLNMLMFISVIVSSGATGIDELKRKKSSLSTLHYKAKCIGQFA